MKHSTETKEKMRISAMGHTRNLGRVHTDETKKNMSLAQKGRLVTAEHREKIRKGNEKFEWVITDPNGIEYKTTNLNQFCKEHGLNQGSMSKVARGKQTKHKGYFCKRVAK